MTHNSRTFKKRRCKTFTGCWTCRRRRVKCDETRPACNRCTLSSRECDGYVIRLAWKGAHDAALSPSASTVATVPYRSLLEPSSVRNGNSLSWNRANDLLNECENATGIKETQSFGPFSVFCASSHEKFGPPHRSTHGTARISQERETDPSANNLVNMLSPIDADRWPTHAPPRVVEEQVRTGIAEPVLQDGTFEADTTPGLGPYPSEFASPSTADHWPSQSHSEEANLVLLLEDSSSRVVLERPHLSHFSDSQTEGVSCAQDLPQDPPPRQLPQWFNHMTPSRQQLDDLPDPSCQVKLIFHWVSFLCHEMVPIDTVHNPYRQIYLPYAYEGMNTPLGSCSSKVALFHGLCAVAAESLLYLGQAGDDVTELLAARHARIALQQLQTSIDVLQQHTLDSTLAAILMCIMRDTVGGHPNHWRGHVCGALKCLSDLTDLTVRPGSHLHVVLGQFLCLAVLGNVSTAYDLQALISRLPEETTHLGSHHGITKFMLEYILMINRLALPKHHSLDPSVIDHLELHVYSHSPPAAPSDSSNDDLYVRVTQNYTHVYQYAMLIHLQRMLRRRPPSELQRLVSIALSHLENTEEVATGSNGCILLWPCLVVAAEAQEPGLQRRALSWFAAKKRHGFGNVDIGVEILRKYWGWREEEPSRALGASWQEFVRDTDLDVVPL